MIRFSNMKKALAAPLIYLLVTALLLAVFTLFNLFSVWSQTFIPGEGMAFSGTAAALPGILRSLFIPSATFGIFLVFLLNINMKKGHFFAFVFTFAVSFLVFIFGFPYVDTLLETSDDTDPRIVLLEDQFNQLEDVYIYPGDIAGEYLHGILLVDTVSPRFSLSPGGTLDGKYQSVYIEQKKDVYRVASRNPAFSPLFNPPGFLEDFLDDIDYFQKSISSVLSESRQRFLFLSFVTVLFCVSCSLFTRISRWPVFNVLGTLLMYRVMFLLYRVLSDEPGRELAGIISSRINLNRLPVTVMIALSILFIAWNILFAPRVKKRRGG